MKITVLFQSKRFLGKGCMAASDETSFTSTTQHYFLSLIVGKKNKNKLQAVLTSLDPDVTSSYSVLHLDLNKLYWLKPTSMQ